MEKDYQFNFDRQMEVAIKIVQLLEEENVKVSDVSAICEKVICLTGKSLVKYIPN